MNKKVWAAVLILVVIFVGFFLYKNQKQNQTLINNNETPEISTEEAITLLFSQRYDRPRDNFVIKVTGDDGSFAQGSINIKNEPGGGMWFAAKTINGWELAFDGNGMISCDAANRYNLPIDMAPTCLDTRDENKLIER